MARYISWNKLRGPCAGCVSTPQIFPPQAFILQLLGDIATRLVFGCTIGVFYALPTTLLVLPLLRQRLRRSSILAFIVILVSAVATGVVWALLLFLVYEHSLDEPFLSDLISAGVIASLIVTPIYFYLTRIRPDASLDRASKPARQP